MKILLIDNYDSFTYNLLHLFAQISGVEVEVVRNDENFLDRLAKGEFDGVIISPGPGNPTDEHYFGNNMKVIENYGLKGLPVLGVCLGFQGIATYFGAKLKKADSPMHGKTSKLKVLENDNLLKGLDSGIEVMRYHSLMIDTSYPLPDEVVFTAEVDRNEDSVKLNGIEMMALRHQALPIYGVQFHPESFASELGDALAKNFVNIIKHAK
ncbi:MAG TPA: aminodeoxychorismate/anthranilate synthase component II [Candidatus Saccharimonadales bacterium]|nr:aminodeoxychorismate/anthranilate synthase component II [Candidatus Saccharimonadales bacterium]